MTGFFIASSEEIKEGETTDIYFVRTRRILKAKGLDHVRVVAEVTVSKLPDDSPWAVLCGVEEVAHLFEDVPVDVYSLPEGTLFTPEDERGFRMPVMVIEGPYYDFCHLETPLLGFLCQESGVATRAARVRRAAGDKLAVAFGVRRMHPALAPALDRAAYIGGLDAVSSLKGAEVIGQKPVGTMPHALIILFGDQVEAWRAFDEVMPPEVPRVALVDTYFDEKVEAVRAAEALGGRLYAVRLDTPGSRRGDFAEIIREVRWELDIRGYGDVKIFVSGGLTEESVKRLGEAGADAFGVGTYISGAPTVDFAMDIVEVEGRPAAKRGKLGGRKQTWRCPRCLAYRVEPWDAPRPRCGRCGVEMEAMLRPLVREGEIVAPLPEPREIRGYVLSQLGKLP
ncbi:MAG: nicotinate phosphoribosyltransferase [Candidatus Bathyarchaeota archaeon B23]|nr:MAG: nicotinate phosphoribosyltransferase [Candidatus Bathyarchaeota archaeon B23]